MYTAAEGGGEYSGLAGEEASDLGSGTKAEAAVQKVVGGLNEAPPLHCSLCGWLTLGRTTLGPKFQPQ